MVKKKIHNIYISIKDDYIVAKWENKCSKCDTEQHYYAAILQIYGLYNGFIDKKK